MVLPYFDYGDILFTNSTKTLLDKLDSLQIRAVKICLRLDGNTPYNILLNSASVPELIKRRDAHLLNYMYKKKTCIELLDIKNINTRARAAALFKTINPNCEKYKNIVFYKGAMTLNFLPVFVRNIDTYDSFIILQKRNMLIMLILNQQALNLVIIVLHEILLYLKSNNVNSR